MKKYLILAALLPVTLMLGGCPESAATNKSQQATKAKAAAESIRFTENAEIDNIKKRIELTASPGLLGYILLLNNAGQPIMYEGVVGKVTSGSKRLTAPMQEWSTMGQSNPLGPSPSDEGTWGTSNEFIFYWNTAGQYRQWNGMYLYSDKPFRLSVEPLVINVEEKKTP